MKYNCTISNMSALPVTLTILMGKDTIAQRTIVKDSPLLCDIDYVSGTLTGMILLNGRTAGGEHARIHVPCVPDVNIKFSTPRE